MNAPLEVAAVGSQVTVIGTAGAVIRDAMVIGVWIRGSGFVQYELAWWNAGARVTTWVDQAEVGYLENQKPATMRIGFHARGDQ